VIHPTVALVGVERVETMLKGIIPGLHRELARTIENLAITVQAASMDKYLNLAAPGPGGLHVKTGTLRRSINYRIYKEKNAITAVVGTNVLYGRFWELGFSGTQHVHPFVRHIKNVMGKIDVGGAMKRRKIASGIAYVRAFDRNVNQRPRPFLRPALDMVRPMIREELKGCMTMAIGEARRGR
jgi:phage gpG-like protein